MSLRGKRPSNLGVQDGQLADGPGKPNWVCSQTDRKGHWIAPLDYNNYSQMAMQALKDLIEAMPRTELVEEYDGYLYFEFSTPLLGFVDDVEFYCDGEVIHVRSASRLGYSDLNANRKRIEAIRAAFKG
jgi:uncharacterized protein (DUF1499 family)